MSTAAAKATQNVASFVAEKAASKQLAKRPIVYFEDASRFMHRDLFWRATDKQREQVYARYKELMAHHKADPAHLTPQIVARDFNIAPSRVNAIVSQLEARERFNNLAQRYANKTYKDYGLTQTFSTNADGERVEDASNLQDGKDLDAEDPENPWHKINLLDKELAIALDRSYKNQTDPEKQGFYTHMQMSSVWDENDKDDKHYLDLIDKLTGKNHPNASEPVLLDNISTQHAFELVDVEKLEDRYTDLPDTAQINVRSFEIKDDTPKQLIEAGPKLYETDGRFVFVDITNPSLDHYSKRTVLIRDNDGCLYSADGELKKQMERLIFPQNDRSFFKF